MDPPPQPQQFHYRNVRIFRDRTLGNGSYGAVYKAMCGLLPCAAKLLHPILIPEVEPGPGVQTPRRQFEQECHFLSTMKHPHIVQYLGTTRDPDSGLPVLLMELMDESLTKFLKRSQQPLFYHVEINLCHDIALALDYLHSNDVIHRDLSSNNVLLIAGSRAKVTDFGMSKLLHISINPRTATKCPGATVYMPPEAIHDHPVYSAKIDCFSFGVLEVQIMTRQFPDPGPATRAVQDPRSAIGVLIPICDSERRKSHIDLIDPTHPLLQTALCCLSYSEGDRPSAQDLCRQIATLKEAPHYIQSVEAARDGGRQAQSDDTVRQLREVREQNEQLSQQTDDLHSQLQQNNTALAQSQRRNQQLRQELRTKDDNLVARQLENQRLRQELHTKDDTIGALQREIQQLQQEVRTKDDTLLARQRNIQQLEQANEQQRHAVKTGETELRYLKQKLQANEQVTAEFQQNLLQQKSIHDLQQTITQLRQSPKEASKQAAEQQQPEARPRPQPRPIQEPKQQKQPLQAVAQSTAKSAKSPPLQQSLSTPPKGIQRGAATSHGESEPSVPVELPTSEFIPGKPVNLEPTPGDSYIELRWDKPIINGDAAATYDIDLKQAAELHDTWHKWGTVENIQPVCTVTVQNLRMVTKYCLRVCARNVKGQKGEYSETDTETTDLLPGKPRYFKAVARTDSEIQLKWCPPKENAEAINKYVIEVSKTKTGELKITIEKPKDVFLTVVESLESATRYTFRLCCQNTSGHCGKWSKNIISETRFSRSVRYFLTGGASVIGLGLGGIIAHKFMRLDDIIDSDNEEGSDNDES